MADLNPLTGQPLLPGQVLVTGGASTGYRQTVVTSGGPLPPWITAVPVPMFTGSGTGVVMQYVDNGRPGGSYSPGLVPTPQQLPDLTVTAPAPGPNYPFMNIPVWVLVALAVGLVALLKSRGSRAWA